jgi:hypothetical protein
VSSGSGELESPWMFEVDGREVNRVLTLARDRGNDVKKIVLWVSPGCLEDSYTILRAHKFERAESRETKIPQLCFIGPARLWRE